MPDRVETKNVSWNVEEQGSGSPLLLVHGYPLDHSMWRFQLKGLSENYRVVAPDLPGFGHSRYKVAPSSLSMKTYADELAELVKVMKLGQVCFCGLSMGGYIGWEFWRHHADALESLVACDTRVVPDSPEVARAREISAMGVERDGAKSIVGGLLQRLFAPATITDQPEIVQATRDVICSSDATAVAAATRAMAVRNDATAWLEKMDLPVLVVVGEHDLISTADEM